ncbi:FadR/GntR family transcriptional regulator [Compostimonas suwonensis]|uniref:DNA-binding FadR family transcriptional regulator n=1 Tax=Compostimonas suwonensis TaxID=1048394 RepID=A0A2M9BB79_9MICO|nr:FCD domain-containing protein [Compostimonas suwonensis]PJJ55198.1 DNA-binding FadR family transcriptional regulator [Compostimonas suwonensis]
MNLVHRHPRPEHVAEALLARIGTGEWRRGQRLPGETTLAMQFGVSAPSMRKAMLELAGSGVLEFRPGVGIFVRSLSPVDNWETAVRRAKIAEVIEGRIAIETEAARLAADRRTRSDLRAMETLLEARNRASVEASVEDYVDIDMEFHRSVIASAHNPLLNELFDSFLPRMRRAMIDLVRIGPSAEVQRTDHDDHTIVLTAIRHHRSDHAATSSRNHLVTLRTSLIV